MQARAELVTFEYTGVVNYITVQDGSAWMNRSVAATQWDGATVKVGYQFSGTFSYDTAMERHPGPPGSENIGYYNPHFESTAPAPAPSIRFAQSGLEVSGRSTLPSV